MKVEILKENLKREISVAERITGRNPSLPILNDVLMEAEDNFFTIISTDLEMALRVWMLTKVVERGRVAIPARLLSGLVSSLPNEKIVIESDNNNINIKCGGFNTKIQGHDPGEFPIVPKINKEEFIEIDSRLMSDGLSCVADIASLSQARPEISGIYFSFSKNAIKMVATDSFRLAEKTLFLEKAIGRDHSFILPQRTAKEIVNILGETGGLARIYVAQNQVLVRRQEDGGENMGVAITSRLIEGEYPHYQDIVPVKFKTKIKAPKDEFLNQIKTASLFSGKINEVKIAIDSEKDKIEIFAKSPDLGESRSAMKIKAEGEGVEISFNHKFLIDGLSRIKSSEVSLSITGQDGPAVLRPVGDDSYLYVVMPIKLT